MPFPGTKNEKTAAFLLFGFLWTYLWLRAAYVPFSHDEIATFFHYVHSERFIPFVNAHWYANNHVLNSILTFFFYKVTGASELSLRMPNVLFFPVFFFFTWRLSQEIRNGAFRWIFVIVLCLAHYFIEFFALCRGYGIAMASLMAAVWYLMQVVKTNSGKDYVRCLVFAAIASLANLTLINSTSLIIFLLSINILYRFKETGIKTALKNAGIIAGFGVLPLAFLALFAIQLQKLGLLDVGTHDGFWKVTMLTNAEVFTGSKSVLIPSYITLVFVLTILFFVVLFLKQKTIAFFFNSRFIPFYLLCGNLFITLFLGIFFNVNYPEDRAAMYFFPLLVASFCLLADDVIPFVKKEIVMAASLPMLLLPLHFFLNMNLIYASFWQNLHIPYRFYEKVSAYAVPGEAPPTIAGYKMRGFAWAFMNYRKGNTMNQVHSSGYPQVNAEFQMAMMKDRADWFQYYDSLDYDPYSDIWLLKKKTPVKLTLVGESAPSSTEDPGTNEYWNFYEGTVDTLIGKTLLFTCDLSITSYTYPFVGRVVISVHDTLNETVRYEYSELDYLRNKWDGEAHNFVKRIIVHELPPGSQRVVVYFWNTLGMEYAVKDGKCRVEVMEPLPALSTGEGALGGG